MNEGSDAVVFTHKLYRLMHYLERLNELGGGSLISMMGAQLEEIVKFFRQRDRLDARRLKPSRPGAALAA